MATCDLWCANKQKKKVDLSRVETLDEPQHCILFYNYAVLLFVARQYSTCARIVSALHEQFAKLLDDKLAVEIGMLYAELLLLTRQVLIRCRNNL